MADKMDIDPSNPPPTRDPRLAARQPQPPHSRKNSLDRLNNLPNSLNGPAPTSQAPANTVSQPDGFIPTISALVQAAVAASTSQAEQARLQKRKLATDDLFNKAKSSSLAFPATAAFFQQARTDEDVDLARINDAIQQHQTKYAQLESTLKAKYSGSLQANSQSDEKVKKLENELQSLKSEVKRQDDSNLALKKDTKELRDRAAMTEKSSIEHSSSLNMQSRQAKQNNDRLQLHIQDLQKDMKSVQSQKASIPPSIRGDIDDLKQKYIKLSSVAGIADTTKALQQKVDDISSRMGTLENSAKNTASVPTKNTDPELKVKIEDMDSRVKNLEVNGAKNQQYLSLESQVQSLVNLKSEVQRLDEGLQDLKKLQEMKDDLLLDQVSQIENQVREQAGASESLGERMREQADKSMALSEHMNLVDQNLNRVSEEMKSLGKTDQFASLSGAIANTQHVLASVKVGLHSLETRYNNLSTEPIVKNMVAAMQEMYPSAGQLTEQIGLLRARVEGLDQAYQGQDIRLKDFNNDLTIQRDQYNKLGNELSGLVKSVTDLWGQLTSAKDQWSDQQNAQKNIQQLQDKIESLEQRFGEYSTVMAEQMRSKDMSEEELRQNLNRERDTLKIEAQDTAKKLKALSRELEEIKPTISSNVDTAIILGENVQELFARVTSLEDSTSTGYQELLAQFDSVKKATETLDQEARDREAEARETQDKETQENEDARDGSLARSEPMETEKSPTPLPKREGSAASDTPNPTEQNSTEQNPMEQNPMEQTSVESVPREKKKKKKRPRPSGLSDDEAQNSPRPSPATVVDVDGAPPSENKKKPKKKKKKKVQSGPFTID